MSLSLALPAVSHEPAETRRLVLLIWAVLAATQLLSGPGVFASLSTDDAMRLVQVRDLLAGQSWFDLTQYRLNPPEGVAMHWSRVIDLPLALLIRTGELLMQPSLAERLALTIWPAGLLLVFLSGTVALARDLADEPAARLALIFAAVMAPVLQHFRPGAIDHHNLQLALTIWSLALLARGSPRAAAAAGALGALSLAVGQEMAPVVAAAAAVVAIRWIVAGEASRQATAAFGIAFAGATFALFVATVPPGRYFAPACDTLSVVQALTAVGGGLGLAMLTTWRRLSSVRLRIAAAAGLGEIVSAVMLLGFPACLGNPYGDLDARLTALWLSNVSEARSIVSLARDLPEEVLPYYGLPILGLVLGFTRCRRERDALRWRWILGTAALAVATLIALWQIRGSAAANAVAAVLVAAALVRSLPTQLPIFFGMGRAVLLAALLVNPLALIAAGKAAAWAAQSAIAVPRMTVIADGPGTCRSAADYSPLASLPRGLVLGFIDAGPFILLQTPHSALAAPFHRNVKGNAAMLDVMLAPPDQVPARLAALGVDYVLFCPGAPERHNYAASAPEGFVAALARGEAPAGFERIALDGSDLVAFRRRP